MIDASTPLLLIGCGNMGSAMLAGWRAALPASHVVAIDRNRDKLDVLHSRTQVRCYTTLEDMPDDILPALVCFAVKPSALGEVLTQYAASRPADGTVFLSVAAGKTLRFMNSHLGESAACVRAMPNTPVMIQQGMTACIANRHVQAEQRDEITRLLTTVGRVEWFNDESLMDSVTAISGSGPAFLFYFMECLMAAATRHGLSDTQARHLIEQTMLGSAMLAARSEKTLTQLRSNVTSPGGTTEAGLAVLKQHSPAGLHALVETCIDAAIARSKALADSK